MSDIEIWRPVSDYEDYYEVSNLGRVRSLPRTDRTGFPGGGFMNGQAPAGRVKYRLITLRDRDRKKVKPLRILVAEAFLPPKPAGAKLVHRDGDCDNCTVSNLIWRERSKPARVPKPESKANAVFRLAKAGTPIADIVSQVGVHMGYAKRVISGDPALKKAAGIGTHRREIVRPELIPQILEMVRSGASNSTIADRFGLPWADDVRQILKTHAPELVGKRGSGSHIAAMERKEATAARLDHPSLDVLKNDILKPGIEKYLTPLLEFRGQPNLGQIHRKFNLAIAMMRHGCEFYNDANFIYHNEDYAQFLGPENTPASLASFFSRLVYKPQVADLVPGLRDYAKFICPRPFVLTPVSYYSSDRRHAWWRAFRADPKAPRKFRLPGSRVGDITYPFLVHEPSKPDEGFELTRLVNQAVPKSLPPDVRADVCQDLIVAILVGDISRDELSGSIKGYVRKVFKMSPSKWGEVSLDAVIPGTDGLTLGSVLV